MGGGVHVSQAGMVRVGLLALLVGLAVGGCGAGESVIAKRASEPSAPPLIDALPRVSASPDRVAERTGFRTFHVDAQHPDASDRNPGTEEAPWQTISRATGRGVLRPGDTVLIHAGIYRETVQPREGGRPGARITFRAVPGDTVVISGADPVTEWHRQPDGLWRTPWTGPSLEAYADDPVFRRELVVVAGTVLTPVFAREDVREGTFWAEGPPAMPRALYARFGDAGPVNVEVALRTYGFRPLGPDPWAECGDPATPGYFHLQGLTIRHHANRAQWGALCAGSQGSLVENATVEWTNGQGISISGRDHVFRQTAADHNGQMGWGGSCTGCLLDSTRARGNNWKGYDPFWESGGSKFVGTSHTVVRGHLAADNDGPGIWFDIDNHDNTIEDCLVENNQVAGIMLELNTVRTLVQHNTVQATRWRSWSGSGILSQAASRNVMLHNTIQANEGSGIWLRLDPDRRAEDGHTVVARNLVRGNVTRRDVEAREVSVEGTSVEHVRTHSFQHNQVGHVGDAEPVWRSSFFVLPASGHPSGFRGDGLAGWRQSVTETGTRMEPGGVLSLAEALPSAGAAGTSARLSPRAGADSR